MTSSIAANELRPASASVIFNGWSFLPATALNNLSWVTSDSGPAAKVGAPITWEEGRSPVRAAVPDRKSSAACAKASASPNGAISSAFVSSQRRRRTGSRMSWSSNGGSPFRNRGANNPYPLSALQPERSIRRGVACLAIDTYLRRYATEEVEINYY